MSNLTGIFNTNIRIQECDPLDQSAIFPHNVEICVSRVPIRKKDGFSPDKIRKLAQKLKSSMVKNGIVFLICYAPIECKSRPFDVAKIMVEEGFNHIDNIVVQRSWFPGKKSEINLVNSHEYVLYFCNGDVWKLDRKPVLEYMQFNDDITCCGNTWIVETGSLDEAYPLDLAELLIRMTDALPGSIVLDLYMGGSGSLQAAIKLGHSFYGFETNEKKMNKYKKLIKELSKGKKNDIREEQE